MSRSHVPDVPCFQVGFQILMVTLGVLVEFHWKSAHTYRQRSKMQCMRAAFFDALSLGLPRSSCREAPFGKLALTAALAQA